jgi:hypothetical protein
VFLVSKNLPTAAGLEISGFLLNHKFHYNDVPRFRTATLLYLIALRKSWEETA